MEIPNYESHLKVPIIKGDQIVGDFNPDTIIQFIFSSHPPEMIEFLFSFVVAPSFPVKKLLRPNHLNQRREEN